MTEPHEITREQVEAAEAEHAVVEKLWQEQGLPMFREMMERPR